MYSYPKIPRRMVSYQFVSAKSERAGEILRTRITRGAQKFVVFPAWPVPSKSCTARLSRHYLIFRRN